MMRRVIIPQAVKIVLPPYGNTMIMMLMTVASLDDYGRGACDEGADVGIVHIQKFHGVYAGGASLFSHECAAHFVCGLLERRSKIVSTPPVIGSSTYTSTSVRTMLRGISATISRGEVVCIIGLKL